MTSFSILSGTVSNVHAASFKDVTDSETDQAVEYLKSLGVVEGYNDGTFKPFQTINRAEFTKMVTATLFAEDTLPDCDYAPKSFSDVSPDAWYVPYLCIAREEGAIGGYSDGSFGPGKNVNTAEAIKIIAKSFYEDVPDAEEGEEWYDPSLDALDGEGALPNSLKNLESALTRGQMAEMLYRIHADASFLPSKSGDELRGIEVSWEGDEELVEMEPEDCAEDEQYDAESRVCYIEIECETDEECEQKLKEIEQNAAEVLGEADDYAELEPSDEEGPPIARYAVSASTIVPVKGESTQSEIAWHSDAAKHQAVWTYFTTLIPESARGDIGAFEIITDGKEGTMAAVYTDEKLPASRPWVLQVDIADAYSESGKQMDTKELAYSLIHEYAHLLTLNARQVDPNISAEDCKQYALDEGCSRKDSIINLFYQKFWASVQGFDKYENQFVTEYAATNVEEDIAESFTHFVLSEPKVGPSMATAKILFFGQYPELRELRSVILSRLQ